MQLVYPYGIKLCSQQQQQEEIASMVAQACNKYYLPEVWGKRILSSSPVWGAELRGFEATKSDLVRPCL